MRNEQMAGKFLFDTSAIIAYLQDEPGAGRIESLLADAAKGRCIVLISFVTMAELYYVTWREEGEPAAKELLAQIKSLPVSVIQSAESITLTAGRIKATCRLSLGDSFIAASAFREDAVLVHKDPEFDQLEDSVKMERLPYKKHVKK
jgi:predicted nucleic acid-binding protein